MKSTTVKQTLDVVCRFTTEGVVLPISFVWIDDVSYDIKKVLDICTGCSMKTGTIGTLYKCLVENTKVVFCFEKGKWYFEYEAEQALYPHVQF